MIRFFDILISLLGLIILSPIFVTLFIIAYFDTKSPIFCQERMGKYKSTFYLFKFRSMYVDSPSVPTHLANSKMITPYGKLLRMSKLDEIPQLVNVLLGDMSLVGPRPNLISQFEVIDERDKMGVYNFRPGITGLSQINKIDMSNPNLLAKTDSLMISQLNILTYFKLILLTIFGFGLGDRIN